MPTKVEFSQIEAIIDDARNGRMFVLVDNEDRENEGDLVIPAQMATPDAINFMTKFGRGLICLALTPARASGLGLSLLPSRNRRGRHETAFTASIEAVEGVTTGISASDRARTVACAIDPTKGPRDITSPGHVFPLISREGGVLVRAGHTEASVDIARLAGLNPSGVICEIMNDDGTMARRHDLVKFAQTHGLRIGTISDLIRYRRRTEKLVERQADFMIDSRHGGSFRLLVYKNKLSGLEHIALIKGEVADGQPVPVRMHTLSVLGDVLECVDNAKPSDLRTAMSMIGGFGRGVVVLIREAYTTTLAERIQARIGSGGPNDYGGTELRDFGVGAQILSDIGISRMELLSNSRPNIVGLDGFDLTVVGYRPISTPDGTPVEPVDYI